MPHLRALDGELENLEREGLLRVPDDGLARAALRAQHGTAFVDFTSNDYLGLAAEHVSRETLSSAPGAGASRLVHGSTAEHVRLEEDLAAWVDFEAALLFTSGYAANVGALGCLLGPGDVVFSDALNHASLIDGCRLSRADVRIVPHLDLETLERELRRSSGVRARWVVVESYYSMDGDSPDLGALRRLCDEHDAHLYVDEAHGLGVFGPAGAGSCAAAGVRADVLLGGLGKACGAQGAFVAGSTTVRRWLWNRARSFVFSTAPSPLLAEVTRLQVQRTRAADALRSRLQERAGLLRSAFERLEVPLIAGSHGPIIAVLVGEAEDTLTLAHDLRTQGLLTQPIRPPTVPPGSCRLRLTVSATHRPEDLERAARAVRVGLESLGSSRARSVVESPRGGSSLAPKSS